MRSQLLVRMTSTINQKHGRISLPGVFLMIFVVRKYITLIFRICCQITAWVVSENECFFIIWRPLATFKNSLNSFPWFQRAGWLLLELSYLWWLFWLQLVWHVSCTVSSETLFDDGSNLQQTESSGRGRVSLSLTFIPLGAWTSSSAFGIPFPAAKKAFHTAGNALWSLLSFLPLQQWSGSM